MTEALKLGPQLRDASAVQIEIEKREAGGLRLSFPASSETPVARYWGTEVLSHDAKAIRMDRMKSGAAPLLFNHDWGDPIGMIDNARIKDGRLWVDAHLFETARARDVAAMVDGGLRNVSIGYELHTVEEDKKTQTYTARDWEVLEVSIVTVPADASVGIGRAQSTDTKPVRVVQRADVSQPAAIAAQQGAAMADQETAAGSAAGNVETRAAAQPRQAPGAQEIEAQRIRAIDNLCKANKIPEQTRNMWVTSGAGLDQVSDDILLILEQRGQNNPQSVAKLDLSEKDAKRFSVLKGVRAIVDQGDWSQAGFELECSREIAKRLGKMPDNKRFYVPFEVQQRGQQAKRDLTVSVSTAGGHLVSTDNMSFIEILRNRSVAYRMGARRMSGLVGNVTVPRQTAAATAVWLASESSTITESQQTFGQMALSPKTVGAYTEISRQLLLQSSPDAEQIVVADLGAVCALAVDSGVLNGSGASGQPTGIINTAGIGSVTGTSLGYAGIIEFQTDVAGANVMPAAGGYVTTPTVAGLLKQRARFSNTDTPLWTGNIFDGQIEGFAAMSSLQMPSANMLFGDWSQVVVGEWGVLEIEVNPYANFQAGIYGVRAMVTMDVGLRYAGAFSLATSIT